MVVVRNEGFVLFYLRIFSPAFCFNLDQFNMGSFLFFLLLVLFFPFPSVGSVSGLGTFFPPFFFSFLFLTIKSNSPYFTTYPRCIIETAATAAATAAAAAAAALCATGCAEGQIFSPLLVFSFLSFLGPSLHGPQTYLHTYTPPGVTILATVALPGVNWG